MDVRRRSPPVPSALAIQIVDPAAPDSSTTTAIRFPSGDQLGLPIRLLNTSVGPTTPIAGPEPSALIVAKPALTNAKRRPSGDHAAPHSRPGAMESGVSARSPLP